MSKKILLVEDAAILALSEAKIIKRHGFDVVTAHSGTQALELFESQKDISLVLMDIDLGHGIDGTEVAEQILAKNDVPIVFLTSHSEKEYVDKVKKITSYGYVLKSSGEFVLIESIQMAYKLYESYKRMEEERKNLQTLINSTPDIICFKDGEGRWLEANNADLELFQLQTVDYQNKTDLELSEFTSPLFREAFTTCKESDEKTWLTGGLTKSEETIPQPGGGKKIYDVIKSPIFNDDGTRKGLIVFGRDISDRKKMAEALKKSEELFSLSMSMSKDGIWDWDISTNQVYYSPAYTEMLGYTQEEFPQCVQSWTELLHPEDKKRILAANYDCIEGKMESFEVVFRMRTKYGQWRWIKGRGQAVKRDKQNKAVRMVGTHTDITIEKNYEIELQYKEKRYRQLFNSMREGVAVYQALCGGEDFEFVDLNRAGLMMGDKSKDEVVGQSVTKVFPGVADMGLLDVLREVYKTGEAKSYPLSLYKDDLLCQWFENYVFKLPSGLIVAVYQDTTHEKLLEEKYRTIVQTSMEGFWSVNSKGYILDVNAAYCSMSGFSRDELLTMHTSHIEVMEDAEQVEKHIHNIMEKGYERFQSVHRKKDGTEFPVEVSTTYLAKGDEGFFVSFIRDISDVNRSLKEKDSLMEELNHRVKNNLMMVSSLISLKNNALGDNIDLSDIAHQVDAIRIIHEKLNNGEQFDRINIRDYLQEILETVFYFSAHPVCIKNNIDKIFLESKQAVSIGLIVNEIATNSVKHGFTTEQSAEFSADLHCIKDGEYVLTLSDNGRMFPNDVDIENTPSLGLQLIKSLVQQLDGSIELKKQPHPVFTIRFYT